jgi:hypothetical protein
MGSRTRVSNPRGNGRVLHRFRAPAESDAFAHAVAFRAANATREAMRHGSREAAIEVRRRRDEMSSAWLED